MRRVSLKGGGRSQGGFGRVELAAVVVVLGLLAWTGWSWRRLVLVRSERAACGNVMRKLSGTFHEFAADTGRYPAAGRTKQPKTNDWVYWQTDREFKGSALAQYFPSFEPRVLRCPKDSWIGRQFIYSYTMNGWTERFRPREIAGAGVLMAVEEKKPNDGCWGSDIGGEKLTARHQGMAIGAFGDGHLEWLKTNFEVKK